MSSRLHIMNVYRFWNRKALHTASGRLASTFSRTGGRFMPSGPEEQARKNIDKLLESCGWKIQNYK
ncbi:MAG: hypothetical protein JRN67_05485, partial [Nitrososphaerota archaeon]|nr:hypothetical protein [Nitrososphaerota archaeon]